jgi:hypothetical protein
MIKGKNMIKVRRFILIFLCSCVIILGGCKTPKKIVIKENISKMTNRLIINTVFRKFAIGVVIGKPFSFFVGNIDLINSLSILDNNDVTLWKINLDNPKSGSGYISYGKVHRAYNQVFPVNNGTPEDLKLNSKYRLILETQKGSYQKEFLYQPGEIYILDSDKVE